MSNNLGFSTVLENQALKEVTINTAFGELDAALTEQFSPALNAGNVALTATQFTKNIVFLISGLTTTGRTLTVRDTRKVFFVRSDAANTQSFNVVLGTTSITVAAGTTALLYTDGTTNGLVSLASGGSGGSGGNPFSVPVVAPEFHSYSGTVSTQKPLRRMGWSNGVQRWADVLEANASLGLYAYDTGGNITGSYTLTPQGQISSSLGTYWHSGNFGRPTSTGGVVGTVQTMTGTGSIVLPSGGTYEFALSVVRTSDSVLLSPGSQGLQARGVAPGGTSLGSLGAGLQWILASWRIA